MPQAQELTTLCYLERDHQYLMLLRIKKDHDLNKGKWIVRPNDQSGYDVLLQRRSANKDSNSGCYDISSAGHMSAGQEPLDAAIREIGEELGITATAEDLVYMGIHRGVFDGVFYGRPFHDREYSYCYLYTRPVNIDDLQLQAEEVESVRWMDYAALVAAMQDGTLPNCIYPDELDMIAAQLGI